jgi:K+-sensing histidine kinase KdpD
LKTYFAPPEREDDNTVKRQSDSVRRFDDLKQLISALPNVVLILNSKRQVVFSNDELIHKIEVHDFRDFLGKRPGELLSCLHSSESESGCGTSEACRYCGAVNTIVKSQRENRTVSGECRINSIIDDHAEAFDFHVSSTPFSWEGEQYLMFGMTDISHLKRRKNLERIFFHDVLNTAGNIKGIADLILQTHDQTEQRKLLKILSASSEQILEEIQTQRVISQAEDGDLIPRVENLNSLQVMDQVAGPFQSSGDPGRKIIIDEESDETDFRTDRFILIRILKNMVKNAIEASANGDFVTLGCIEDKQGVSFWVHNPQPMSSEVRHQVFTRNYSTKGSGRGLGTYSMKLLGERYLNGKVRFTSDLESGTTFYVDLPA